MTSEQKNTFYIGYRQLTQSELDKYTTDNPPHRPYPYEAQINDTVEMRAFESTCNHMNTDGTNWSTDGCLVGHSFQISKYYYFMCSLISVFCTLSTCRYPECLRSRCLYVNVSPWWTPVLKLRTLNRLFNMAITTYTMLAFFT